MLKRWGAIQARLTTLASIGAYVFIILFLCWQIVDGFFFYGDLKAYQERGVKTFAHIERYTKEDCTRLDCALFAHYSFLPSSKGGRPSGPFSGKSMICEGDCTTDEDYKFTISTHTIPIVYDPQDPRKSTANWRNAQLTRSPFQYLVTNTAIFGSALLIFLAIPVGAFFWGRHIRKRRAALQAGAAVD